MAPIVLLADFYLYVCAVYKVAEADTGKKKAFRKKVLTPSVLKFIFSVPYAKRKS